MKSSAARKIRHNMIWIVDYCMLTWGPKLLSAQLRQFILSDVLQCVVGGCNASFASQGGLARHVPSHFSQQSSSKLSSQAKLKEESPSKAGLNKRKKLKNKRRCSLRTYPADSLNRPRSPRLQQHVFITAVRIAGIDVFIYFQPRTSVACGEAKGWTTHT